MTAVIGPHTGRTLTAFYHEEARCWTYRDALGRGPSLGWGDNCHATEAEALAVAVERDIIAAAQGARSPLSRKEYEAEALRLGGLQLWDDLACWHMMDGDWDLPTYGVIGAAARTLAARRGYAIDNARKAARQTAPDAPEIELPRCRVCGGDSPQTTIGGGVCDDCV